MSFVEKINKIIERHSMLEDKLNHPENMSGQEYAKTSKDFAELKDVYEHGTEYLQHINNIKELEEMLADSSTDAELKEIAEQDLRDSKNIIERLTQNLKIALLPKDIADEKNAILEVRAGTGGDEAALFAAELFMMYRRYAESKNWSFEVLSKSETGLDGYKEASALISGKGAYARLKFESGVHRVQRVPETESSGRIHTSAATVAVLPEAEEVDVEIADKDIRIDLFRASGAGGQHVNTTDSAVRITHLPTGIVVSQQDEKSQHKNKAKALKILRSRIFDAERAKMQNERSEMRKGQVGSGDRSERIRTYNFPQSRLTDHRINFTSYQLETIVAEGKIDEIINALIAEDQAQKLTAIEEEN